MASKKTTQRKKNAAIRSAQVKKNISQLDVINTPYEKINTKSLNYMSRAQLTQLAGKVGLSYESAQATAAQYRKSHEFFESPPPRALTKKEREFARRKMPTLQEIASAPPKRAKLLRQQRNKISAAKDLSNSIKDYLEENGLGRASVESYRRAQFSNNTGNKSYAQNNLGSSDISSVLRNQNVLRKSEIVRTLTDKQLRSEIQDRLKDIKLIEQNLGKDKRPAISDRDNQYMVRILTAAFGEDVARNWGKLSKADRYALINQTDIMNQARFYAKYDHDTHEFVHWEFGENASEGLKIRQDIAAFMRNARNISNAIIE